MIKNKLCKVQFNQNTRAPFRKFSTHVLMMRIKIAVLCTVQLVGGFTASRVLKMDKQLKHYANKNSYLSKCYFNEIEA